MPEILLGFSNSDKSIVVDEVLRGRKRICLAITEPNAGSDVHGILTEAEISANGKSFVVNGQKKVSRRTNGASSSNEMVVDYLRHVCRLLLDAGQR